MKKKQLVKKRFFGSPVRLVKYRVYVFFPFDHRDNANIWTRKNRSEEDTVIFCHLRSLIKYLAQRRNRNAREKNPLRRDHEN